MCKTLKGIFSFLVILFAAFSFSAMASAEKVESQKGLSNLDKSELVEISNSELVPAFEVIPFYRDPRLQSIDSGSGITRMTTFQTGKFVSSVGYPSEHAFKTDMLKGITTQISRFNIFYHKTTRQVFLINSENLGLFTGYHFIN